MIECAWCKKEYKEKFYPNVLAFMFSFEEGTISEDYGPNLTGYEVNSMCSDCAWKLRKILADLGIEIMDVNT